jgi:hypothetical protein
MSAHCYGPVEIFPGVFTQADCGQRTCTGGHAFSDDRSICPGAAAGVEGYCGYPGRHDAHPLGCRPEVSR